MTARKASGAISQPISVTGAPGGGGRVADLEQMVRVAAHPRARIVVEGEVVELLLDDVEIALLHQRLDHLGGERLRITAEHLRIGKRAVQQRVEHLAGDPSCSRSVAGS